MNEPRGQELIQRYTENYGISNSASITEEMILYHWELEKQLTQEILNSTPESRWETFEKCYTTLYKELYWLNCPDNYDHEVVDQTSQFSSWQRLIGPSAKKIYEIGSGKAELITYLAEQGYECKATEITRERGEKWSNNVSNLTWATSDGVHLEKFEPENTYNVVISDQVIEHLHPDDLLDHFRGVFTILAPGGRYIFKTPHSYTGPSDISRVFNKEKPEGMHLREYTFRELFNYLKMSGFRRIYTLTPGSTKVYRIMGNYYELIRFLYLKYIFLIEGLIGLLPSQSIRFTATTLAEKHFRFSSQVLLIGEKN